MSDKQLIQAMLDYLGDHMHYDEFLGWAESKGFDVLDIYEALGDNYTLPETD